ncbi:MAG: response regulator [Desulfobacteraceae bacterium]
MHALIVEDDVTSRKILENVLSRYGTCDFAANGLEAVAAFRRALDETRPFDLICMDIMMPELSGQDALQQIRGIEKEAGVNTGDEVMVFMTTALTETVEVIDALYKGGASAYFVKPIQIDNFINELKSAKLIE